MSDLVAVGLLDPLLPTPFVTGVVAAHGTLSRTDAEATLAFRGGVWQDVGIDWAPFVRRRGPTSEKADKGKGGSTCTHVT